MPYRRPWLRQSITNSPDAAIASNRSGETEIWRSPLAARGRVMYRRAKATGTPRKRGRKACSRLSLPEPEAPMT